MTVKVSKYNAYGDGVHNDAEAFNAAIAECNKAGGGTVVAERGKTYRCGTIFLKSNVTLCIEEGAKIIASDSLSDFYDIGEDRDVGINRPTWENCEYNGKPSKYFIYAVGAENIGITGGGTIDGNEEIFYGKVTKWHIEGAFYPRVPLIYFENCKKVTIAGVTLQRSAFWTTHLVGCRNVFIDGLNIKNNIRLANCDGIDPDHCKNVEIRNCNIECADDCIVFKTTEGAKEYGACENIHVTNCKLMSTSAAIKFGTESVGNFKDISVENCEIVGTNRGISVMLRDEGNIENVSFRNIKISTRRFSPVHWWGKAEPVAVTAVRRKPSVKVGGISWITFENISADGENGILIYGEKRCNISGLRFKNVSLEIVKKTDWEKGMHDLRPSEEYGLLQGETNVLHIRNAKDVTFENFEYTVSDDMQISKPLDIENASVEFK